MIDDSQSRRNHSCRFGLPPPWWLLFFVNKRIAKVGTLVRANGGCYELCSCLSNMSCVGLEFDNWGFNWTELTFSCCLSSCRFYPSNSTFQLIFAWWFIEGWKILPLDLLGASIWCDPYRQVQWIVRLTLYPTDDHLIDRVCEQMYERALSRSVSYAFVLHQLVLSTFCALEVSHCAAKSMKSQLISFYYFPFQYTWI